MVLAVEQNGVLSGEVDCVAVKGSFEERSSTRWKQFGLIKGFWTENWEPEGTPGCLWKRGYGASLGSRLVRGRGAE